MRDRILELYAEAPKSVFKNVPLNVAVFNGRVLYLIRNKRCRPPEAFLVNLLNSLRRAKAEKLSKPEAAAVKWFQTTVEKVFALLGAVQLLEGEARSAEPPVQRVCERGTSSEAPEKARLRLADRQPAKGVASPQDSSATSRSGERSELAEERPRSQWDLPELAPQAEANLKGKELEAYRAVKTLFDSAAGRIEYEGTREEIMAQSRYISDRAMDAARAAGWKEDEETSLERWWRDLIRRGAKKP